MTLTRTLLAAGALCATLPSSFAATLINGNFEANAAAYTVWPGYNGQDGVNPASPAGWTSTGGVGINPVQGNPPNGPAPFNDGSNTGAFAFLQNTARIEQTVNDFVVGQSYVLSLSFNARNCCGDIPIGSVYLDDTLLASSAALFPDPGGIIPASIANNNDWYSASIPFIASATSHILNFRATPASGNPAADATFLLDNVSITTVPEPAAGILSAAAFTALSLRRNRR